MVGTNQSLEDGGQPHRGAALIKAAGIMNKSRRNFLGTSMAAVAAARAQGGGAAGSKETFVDIIRPPDLVAAYVEGTGRITLSKSADRWQADGVEVTAEAKQSGA